MAIQAKNEFEAPADEATESDMTAEQNTAEPAGDSVEPTNEAPEQDTANDEITETETDTTDTAAKKANREAAKYRTQLRESEERYSALNAQHTNLVRQMVEGNLPGNLSPKLLWKLCEPEEFMTDEGTVDTEEVNRRAGEIIKEFSLNPANNPVPTAGKQPGKSSPNHSLSAAFKPRR